MMGVYSTHEGLTKEQAMAIIRDRISKLEFMPDPRIVEILEACVQGREYNTWDAKNKEWVPNEGCENLIDGGWSDEYAYNNFWPYFNK